MKIQEEQPKDTKNCEFHHLIYQIIFQIIKEYIIDEYPRDIVYLLKLTKNQYTKSGVSNSSKNDSNDSKSKFKLKMPITFILSYINNINYSINYITFC